MNHRGYIESHLENIFKRFWADVDAVQREGFVEISLSLPSEPWRGEVEMFEGLFPGAPVEVGGGCETCGYGTMVYVEVKGTLESVARSLGYEE